MYIYIFILVVMFLRETQINTPGFPLHLGARQNARHSVHDLVVWLFSAPPPPLAPHPAPTPLPQPCPYSGGGERDPLWPFWGICAPLSCTPAALLVAPPATLSQHTPLLPDPTQVGRQHTWPQSRPGPWLHALMTLCASPSLCSSRCIITSSLGTIIWSPNSLPIVCRHHENRAQVPGLTLGRHL